MSIAGTWHLVIKTPIGRQEVVLELVDTYGELSGTATGDHESVPILDAALHVNNLSWRQSITRPMRLDLHFDVTIDGDTLSGTSRAGRLPKSNVTGTRSA